MDLVRATIRLSNPKRSDLSPVEVEALVDTGAVHLWIPERIVIQLALQEQEKRSVTVADGGMHVVPYVGPVQTTFGTRNCFTGAMVLGTEVLLGAIPMDDMDLVVRPLSGEIGPNPLSPNMPTALAVGVRPS